MSHAGIELETLLAEARGKLQELRGELSPRKWAQQLRASGFTTSHNTVIRQESGESNLDAAYVLACARFTGCSLEWLLGDHGPKYATLAVLRGEKTKLPDDVAAALAGRVEELFTEQPRRRALAVRAG